MERRGRDNGRKAAVPQFGAWDQKGETSPNYSMVFGQARAHRKQAKTEVRPLNLREEAKLITQQDPHAVHRHHHEYNQTQDDSVMMKKNKFLTYCCVRPY